jgi:hypothetical protein
MTLVAAFRCRDNGILLCADRQDDDGYVKRPVDKIYRETGLSNCEVFIAGSGPTTAVLDSCQEIHKALEKAAHYDKSDVLIEHQSIIEASLKAIHIKHKEDLKWMRLGLLIVVVPRNPNGMPILYRNDRSTLIPESEYAAHGTGKPLSDYFAIRLYKYGQPNDYLAVLAAFILREAEESVSGVGLGSDMIFIRSGISLRYLHTDSISEIQAGIPPLKDAIHSYWGEHIKVPDWLKKNYAATEESPE